jgi:hypothetical protein
MRYGWDFIIRIFFGKPFRDKSIFIPMKLFWLGGKNCMY